MDKPITLCDRCDIVMSCLLDYDGVLCRRNRTVQPTNADRIRAMTDDELAEFLGIQAAKWCNYMDKSEEEAKWYREWLKSPVEEK